jgi:hypothetical protein
MVVDLKTAKALGLTVPPSILLRAERPGYSLGYMGQKVWRGLKSRKGQGYGRRLLQPSLKAPGGLHRKLLNYVVS